ncbi:MAG: IclR family transcriptional regulator [Mesorhizobium sp.]|nr:MAG: IclR family transcriptional regulator [Mesorhizobium sp.]
MRSQTEKSETEQAKGTQLLDRSVALLNYLGEVGEQGARIQEMAKALGLTGSTAHRIVSALERHLLIERETSTKRYRLGLSLFALGAKAADGTGLRRLCRPALTRLAAQTGDTVFLMARSGFNTVCVDRQEGIYVIDSLTGHIGGQVPLGVGSASLAILAYLPPEEADAIISANAHLYGAFDHLSADEIRRQLPAIRERGYALDQGHLVAGISALALPIRPQGRDVMAALAINTTSARMPAEQIPELVASIGREVEIIERSVNPLDLVSRRRTRSIAKEKVSIAAD